MSTESFGISLSCICCEVWAEVRIDFRQAGGALLRVGIITLF